MVISTVNQVVYNGDGITTAWPYTFRIIDATDIKLTIIDADGTETDVTADYFVDTVNNTVYYPGYAPGAEPPQEDQPPKLQTGQRLVVYRELPITQEKDLGEKWPFYVIELALDKLTMILQQVFDWWGRTLRVSLGKDITEDVDLTVPMVPDTVITVNADGTGFDAREALMEVDDAWDSEGRQIKGVGEPTDDQDAATKKYADDNFMKLEEGVWEARGTNIRNVKEPEEELDATTKRYVDNCDTADRQYVNDNALLKSSDGTTWEGRDLPIKNVADPVDTFDAATKHYVDKQIEEAPDSVKNRVFDYIDSLLEGSGDGTFQYDHYLDLMPTVYPVGSDKWDIDENGDIMPKAEVVI